MKKEDKDNCIKRYSERYKMHGYSPMSLGWGKHSKQNNRFLALSEIGLENGCSVLDVGCGFGDFLKYLNNKKWSGRYRGVDLVDDLLAEALIQNPKGQFANIDILNNTFEEKFEYVISSGIFNAKLISENNYKFAELMLSKMFEIATKGVAVDFLSTYVDFEQENNFHSDPSIIFKIAKTITKRVTIRHDYLPYEFTLYMYKNDSINKEKHTFIEE